MKWNIAILAVACLLQAWAVHGSSQRAVDALAPGCRSESGTLVDFWVAFKKNVGYNYLYADVNDLLLKPSPFTMKDNTTGALAQTASQMWSGLEYIAFNDEPATNGNATSTSSTVGHSKGFIAFSTLYGYGFWITHSTPAFPLTPAQVSNFAGLGDNADVYAQDFLCVSLTLAEIETLASQLVHNQPAVYSKNVKPETLNNYPGIRNLTNQIYPTTAKCVSAKVGFTTVFAKTAAWNQDVWASCIATAYKTDLYVESWLRGLEIGPSCPPAYAYATLDVDYVSFTSTYQWKETQDHSKWAIGITKPIVCFGDINRMTSQYKRGGGATCFENQTLWQQMKAAVTQHGVCAAANDFIERARI